MPTPQPLLDPEAMQRIARLDLLARQVVEGTLAGLHRSIFHGFSIEFLQHRPYVPGDDLRYLDWKVLGRTDRHYVRQFEDETNLRATILLDASGSMGYRSGTVSKLDYAVRFAASLAYLLVEQQDSVGLVVFDESHRVSLPSRSGRRQLKAIFDELERTTAGGETSLAKVIHGLVPRIPRRGLVLVLTDAFDDVDALLNSLVRLRNEHHEVILFQILDRREVDFDFGRWTRFDSLESDEEKILADPAQVRRMYLERFESFQRTLREGCHRHRVDVVPGVTDVRYDEALASFLANRGARE